MMISSEDGAIESRILERESMTNPKINDHAQHGGFECDDRCSETVRPTREQMEWKFILEAHVLTIEGFRREANKNWSNVPERKRYLKLAEKKYAELETYIAHLLMEREQAAHDLGFLKGKSMAWEEAMAKSEERERAVAAQLVGTLEIKVASGFGCLDKSEECSCGDTAGQELLEAIRLEAEKYLKTDV